MTTQPPTGDNTSSDGEDQRPCSSGIDKEKDTTEELQIARAVEKLTINDPKSSPADDADEHDTSRSTRTIICDAWYGLPTQKRPRRERVNAVARQLRNFELSSIWSCCCTGTPTSTSCATCNNGNNKRRAKYRIVLVGGEADVKVIGERLDKLREDGKADVDDDDECRVQLLPGVSVEAECKQALAQRTSFTSLDDTSTDTAQPEDAIYLSPEAKRILDPCKSPPTTVVVGMLIDRRVQPNRSSLRAEKIHVQAARLPMEELRTEGLDNSEALNVDTVLELMVCWWDAVDGSVDGVLVNGEEDTMRRCFVEAATSAMVSHEDRHPNRPLHGSGKS